MSPHNTVIVFDLHGVLFKHDYKKMAISILKHPQKLKLLLAVLSPSLWIDTIKLLKKGAIAEEFLVGLADNHHRLKPFVPFLIRVSNMQIPQKPVLELCKKLKNQGYKLYILSNIGSIIFQDFKKRFPEIIKLFHGITIPSRETGYIHKPDPLAFSQFTDKNDLQSKKIIFIDDKRKNVKKALELEIWAILFKSTENLETELKMYVK